MTAEPKLQGLIRGMSSEDYHKHKGTWSSSQLKVMNEDPEVFYKIYIEKTEEKENIPAFDIGTYFHTAILEPEKLKSECAVYAGTRSGKVWDSFKEQNKGKAIITENEFYKAKNLIDATKNSPIAMQRIARGEPEVSAFVDVQVYQGEVYSMDGRMLTRHGWSTTKHKLPKKGVTTLCLKVRADLLADNFILDLKSTTGNCKDEYAMKQVISKYCYQLSAAMYLDLFTIATGRVYDEFVWTFASKDLGNSKSYLASKENIILGRVLYKKALVSLAYYIETDWAFEDSMGILEPQIFEREHLKVKGEDLV